MDLIHADVNIRPQILPIVITAYASKAIAVGAFKEGIYDFLEKPLTPGMVLQTVGRAWKALRTELENRKLLRELRAMNEALKVEIINHKRTNDALLESQKRYKELSIKDSLTKLYNSRYFFSQLKAENRRADR